MGQEKPTQMIVGFNGDWICDNCAPAESLIVFSPNIPGKREFPEKIIKWRLSFSPPATSNLSLTLSTLSSLIAMVFFSCFPLHSRSPWSWSLALDCGFDDDSGVIWKGDTLIEGVSKTLDLIRSKARFLSFCSLLFFSISLHFASLIMFSSCMLFRVKMLCLWPTIQWNQGGNTLKSSNLWVSFLLLRYYFNFYRLGCSSRISC